MRSHATTRRRPRPRVERACRLCGVLFATHLAKIEEGGGIYCSRHCRNQAKIRPLAERFWEKVDRSGDCWLWLAGKNSSGYGIFVIDGRKHKAHRVAWELLNGPIPDDLNACHNCPTGDNPACVNPAHLFLGTQADNMRDCAAKGRAPKGLRIPVERVRRGNNVPNARLDPETVRAIRSLAREGMRHVDIAARFGVATSTISPVVRRATWAHIE